MDRSRRRPDLIGLALVCACAVDEGPVPTDALRMDVDIVIEDGLTSQAEVVFADGAGILLLEPIDEVQIFIPEWLIDLIANTQALTYQGQIPAAPEETLFTVAVLRDDADSAPISTVLMPAAPALVLPAAFSGVEPVQIAWTPSSAPTLVLELEGVCIEPARVEVLDSLGSWTFSADRWAGVPCDVLVSAHRVVSGEVDASFQDGRIVARQTRSWVVPGAR